MGSNYTVFAAGDAVPARQAAKECYRTRHAPTRGSIKAKTPVGTKRNKVVKPLTRARSGGLCGGNFHEFARVVGFVRSWPGFGGRTHLAGGEARVSCA